MTGAAEGDLLSNWGNMLGVSRTYYGHNACIKPNDHCFWDKEAHIVGWYETDGHMRVRVVARYTHNPVSNEEVFKDAMRSTFPDVWYSILEDQTEHVVTIAIDSGDCEAIRRAALRIIPTIWGVRVIHGAAAALDLEVV